MSKVSIIVPIYNVEKYLNKCFDSLLNQTFEDMEILAINDGSPDNSESVILEYQKKDSRIRYIKKENGGYGSVLELGIKEMDSEYFLICDPDDYLEKNCIETLYSKAIQDNLDIVAGSKYLIYSDGDEQIYSDSRIENICPEIKVNTVYEDTKDFFFLEPSPHSKLFRKTLALNIEFPYRVSYTDYLLYSLCLENAKRVMYLEEPLAYYLVDRPGNTTTDLKEKVFSDYYVVISSVFRQMKNDAMYARQYIHFRYVLSLFKERSGSDTKKKYFEDYFKLYGVLLKNRNKIIQYYPCTASLKMRFLLSGLFKKTFLRKMMGL